MAALHVQYFFRIFLLALLIIGHVDSNSRALRKLNKQFNLLRRSVERDIEDLTYEVTDLQTQLELERERASTLAELLNSTDLSLPDLIGGESTSSKDLIDKYSTLEKEVINLKKQNKQLKKTAEAHTREIADAKRDMKALNDSATQLADSIGSNNKPFAELEIELKESIEDIVSVITQALGDEKRQLRDLKNKLLENNENQVQLDLEATVDQIISNHSIIVDLGRVQASCSDVGNLTKELRSDIDTIRDDVNEVVRNTDLNGDKLEALADCCKAKAVATQKPVVTADPKTTMTPNITSSTQSKDYLVYAVFGENITQNIRVGSRVIRGKDWSWQDQDGGGPGTVTGWVRNDPGAKEVHVRWDAGEQVNYRVGVVKKYDLYLITGGDADHLAGTSTLRFKPIFKADLEAAITIGSRVIKGEDWAWRDQDGGGPGIVTGWYSGKKSTRQVMVDWDLGTKANYRVGAHGKFDLFLLVD